MGLWLDGKTAPQNGSRFLAAWRVSKTEAGSLIKTDYPGQIVNVAMIPGDFRILQRVWWDGQAVYSDPHFWMPFFDARIPARHRAAPRV